MKAGPRARGSRTTTRHFFALLLAICSQADATVSATSRTPTFEVSIAAHGAAEKLTGRLFLLISRVNSPEVRLQSTGFNSPEMIATDVHELEPGRSTTIDSGCLGYPLHSLAEIPDGDYFVQAILNVYTEFRRSDGHVVWAHMDQWEGQQFTRSPGNLYSKVARVHIGPGASESINLALTEVIAPQPPPVDSGWVKHLKLRSPLLSAFWGHDIYIGATVLLPRDYESEQKRSYPIVYGQQGHFTLEAPFSFATENTPESDQQRIERQQAGYESGFEFGRDWRADDFPRLILVTFQHPTPFADWSGAMNSANNGPYGDAIMQELIPAVEQQFRVRKEPGARTLIGKASGGRDAIALLLQHPDFFGGAWVFYPWAFNFERYFVFDVYHDANAFVVEQQSLPLWARSQSEWLPLERYIGRTTADEPLVSMRQLSLHDAVLGGAGPGGEFGADDSILGPVGADGYPRKLWDRTTGELDPEVARFWRTHGDLAQYAEDNWAKIGSKLIGKLHIFVGEMDEFHRNEGVHMFEERLRKFGIPLRAATFEYGQLKGHWQPMTNAQLLRMIAQQRKAQLIGER